MTDLATEHLAASPTLKKLNPLTMPLKGLQVIEASAGTGKTWTLAALYVRLVLGHVPGGTECNNGLYPPQILVMTFTEAATAELRGRIRERLSQAARFFSHGEQNGFEVDDFLRALRTEIDADQWPACAYRLDMAAQWMDDAAIFTIHGWSSRMLKTHAFDSASLFQQSRVEDSDQIKLNAVQDYWRKWFYPMSIGQLGALKMLGATPEELFSKLSELWVIEDKAPQSRVNRVNSIDSVNSVEITQAPDGMISDWEIWQTVFLKLEDIARSACTDAVIALLNDTVAAKTLKGYRADWPGKLAEWAQGESIALMNKTATAKAFDTLQRFSSNRLVEKGWGASGEHLVFAHIEAFCDHLGQEPQVSELLLAHAAFEVGAAYRQAKAQLAQFDFSDLLQHLYHALQAPDGRLATAIRQQYPVALVDEFQDTDPWQYGALSKIYGQFDTGADTAADTGLIMIGDPKQAIYSFRGADLNTYLTARHQAQAIHTLSGNFRSTHGVVAAVNHVFSRATQPFGEVPFERVTACNDKVLPVQVGGQAQVAMTVWHLQNINTPNKNVLLRQMAELFATQMVALLNQGAARPGDMAVLVRGWPEARAIRTALADRGVRSVYLSERDSVFSSPQATDLWRILQAVANPRATHLVRAALATRLWDMSWTELEALFQNEQAWDNLSERFHHWQQIWQRQGFLPMLHHLLHDQSIPARLLNRGDSQNNNGERQLTNLLHLGDLLQSTSLGLQGEGALIRYLEDQLRRPKASGDTAQLRLESDANLVQVITMHKAKGLQYPLVFLPFVSNYRAEKAGSGKDDALRLAEDIRLVYVALTRAEQALWVGIAQTKGDVDGKSPAVKSAVSMLLGRQATGDLAQCLKGWKSEHIEVQNAPAPDNSLYTPKAADKIWMPALAPQRNLISQWWTASFSALTRGVERHAPNTAIPESERDDRIGDAQIDSAARGALYPTLESDLQEMVEPRFNAFKAGTAYGTLLHDLLEWQAQKGWPAAQLNAAKSVTAQWHAVVTRKAQRLNLDEAEQALLPGWIQTIATTPLPVPLPLSLSSTQTSNASSAIILGAIPLANTWAEMSFTLKIGKLGSIQLDRLIQQHVMAGVAREALQPRQLEGMLTGLIDLVLEFEGRYYVLDYKSNKLPAYSPAHLQQAILAHRYDVQYTLYLLALHRLLKSRLPDYDYDLHVGGALYLFLRGIDQPGAGLQVERPPKALIEALDTAFSDKHDQPDLSKAA